MPIQELLEAIDKEKRLNAGGEEKIAKVISGEAVDLLPLIFWKPTNTGIPGKTYNLMEQFSDKKKMLYGQLEEIADCARDVFDAQLCVRPNFGTIFIPAMLGLDYKVFKETYPWLVTHMTRTEICRMRFPDLDGTEMMKRAIEYIEYFKEILPDWIHIYQPDTQGPFDIAHLVYGDNIFYDLYDDPGFVHELMDMCTQMYIEVTKKMKAVIGEENYNCYHGHGLVRGIFMDSGGARISEDSATLISPAQIDEFVIPYVKKAFKEFGGGFVHFCGKNESLLDAFLMMNEVRAINLGNPEMYDFKKTMEKFLAHGKCCFGLWPKRDGETVEQYMERMKNAGDNGTRGLLLHFDEAMFPEYSCEQIHNIWGNR